MAKALPTSTTSYLAKFGIGGSHVGSYVADPDSMQCAECGQDTGTDPDTHPAHAECRTAHRIALGY